MIRLKVVAASKDIISCTHDNSPAYHRILEALRVDLYVSIEETGTLDDSLDGHTHTSTILTRTDERTNQVLGYLVERSDTMIDNTAERPLVSID